MSIRTVLLTTAALLGAAAGAHATTFGFAGSAGQSNPFAVTAGGNTATFTSTAGPGTFAVANSGFFTFGVGLGDYGSFSGDPLTITFATPVTQGIVIPFGLEDFFGTNGFDMLTASANTGQVVTASTTLNNLTIGQPEGSLYVRPTQAITSLVLTSSNPFAIASIDVPEPMSLSLLGVGLAGLAVRRRRA